MAPDEDIQWNFVQKWYFAAFLRVSCEKMHLSWVFVWDAFSQHSSRVEISEICVGKHPSKPWQMHIIQRSTHRASPMSYRYPQSGAKKQLISCVSQYEYETKIVHGAMQMVPNTNHIVIWSHYEYTCSFALDIVEIVRRVHNVHVFYLPQSTRP